MRTTAAVDEVRLAHGIARACLPFFIILTSRSFVYELRMPGQEGSTRKMQQKKGEGSVYNCANC
jgi:hypothetical protein